MLLQKNKLTSLGLEQEDAIRSKSCGARGASLYLVGPLTHDDRLPDFFMAPEVFATAIRLRLGLAVRPLHDTCAGCAKHMADTKGHASLKCMKCGHRTRAHNNLRDTLADICRTCLLSPSIESKVSNKPGKEGIRADITFFRSGTMQVIDTAITHPFRDATTRVAASITAGAAATLYEDVKVAHYKDVLTKSQSLVPFVCDTYGALGETAQLFLQQIVPLFARRLGIPSSIASRIIFGRITGSVIKSMATAGTLL